MLSPVVTESREYRVKESTSLVWRLSVMGFHQASFIIKEFLPKNAPLLFV
jgi:hypothetical protein